MATPRKRYTPDGKPRSCLVQINDKIAPALYRETREKGYADETELVNEIVRRWAAAQPPVDWPALLTELKADEDDKRKADQGE